MADGTGGATGIAPTGARLAAPPVHRITLAQLAVLGILSLLTYRLAGSTATVSLLAGGACNVVPQAWFAFRLFGNGRRGPAAARVAYGAEAAKFMLSALGFALVFALLRPVAAPAVFGGFAAMLFVQVAGSVWLLRRGQGAGER